jgi:hypothetical protein
MHSLVAQVQQHRKKKEKRSSKSRDLLRRQEVRFLSPVDRPSSCSQSLDDVDLGRHAQGEQKLDDLDELIACQRAGQSFMEPPFS